MKAANNLTLKDYLAGAAFANSLVWLVLGLTVASEINYVNMYQLFFILYLIGAITAGYLVSRKSFNKHIKIGLITGASAFVIHIYVFMGLLEWLWGQRVMGLFDHLLILPIFILGAVIGTFVCKQISSGTVVYSEQPK